MAEAPAHAWGVPQLDVAPARLEERAAASKFACVATTRCAIARSAPPTNKGWLPRAEHFERLGWVKHGSGEACASKSASLEHPSCLRTSKSVRGPIGKRWPQTAYLFCGTGAQEGMWQLAAFLQKKAHILIRAPLPCSGHCWRLCNLLQPPAHPLSISFLPAKTQRRAPSMQMKHGHNQAAAC